MAQATDKDHIRFLKRQAVMIVSQLVDDPDDAMRTLEFARDLLAFTHDADDSPAVSERPAKAPATVLRLVPTGEAV